MTTEPIATEPVARPSFLQRYAQKEGKRFARFMVVGAIGFVIDFGISNLAHAFGFGTWVATHIVPNFSQQLAFFLTQNPEVVEQTLSLSVAILSNFFWNYFWIYPEARQANQADKLVKFIVVSIAGLAVGVPVTTLALLFWRGVVASLQLASVGFNLAGNLAQVTRVGILLFWNFFVNR
jgi:putative flippase GtrA